MVLGLGSQVPAANRKWHGLSFESTLDAFDEYVAAIRMLLSSGEGLSTRFKGDRLVLRVPPFHQANEHPPPPIAIGAAGRRSLAQAAKLGDMVLGHLFSDPGSLAEIIRATTNVEKPITIARLAAPSSVPGWQQDAAIQLAHYAATPSYQSHLAALGINTDREAVQRALPDHGPELVDLAAPLVQAFSIHDAASLNTCIRDAASARIDSVILLAPNVPGTLNKTAVYERAIIDLVSEVSDNLKGLI